MYRLGIYKSLNSTEENDLIAKLRVEFPHVFREGTIKDMKGQLRVKPNTEPRYMKARTVPYPLKTKVGEELDKSRKVPYHQLNQVNGPHL